MKNSKYPIRIGSVRTNQIKRDISLMSARELNEILCVKRDISLMSDRELSEILCEAHEALERLADIEMISVDKKLAQIATAGWVEDQKIVIEN